MPPVVLLKSTSKPTAVFWTPLVLLKSANAPLAVFWLPVVLLKSAPAPVAVFSPAVLARSAPAPRAVFNWPVVSLLSEKKPTAVLKPPVVRLKSADRPSAVLPPGYPPSGAGATACIVGTKASGQRNTSTMRRGRIFIFIASTFAKNPAVCREANLQCFTILTRAAPRLGRQTSLLGPRSYRLEKCFGHGIRQCFAFLGEHEVAFQFSEQTERDKLVRLSHEMFQIRSRNSIACAQRERDSLHSFHFSREIFG